MDKWCGCGQQVKEMDTEDHPVHSAAWRLVGTWLAHRPDFTGFQREPETENVNKRAHYALHLDLHMDHEESSITETRRKA